MSTTIAATDLKPGDVFLYQGTSLVSRLIRLFDGTEYSHASINDGAKVAETLCHEHHAKQARQEI